LERAFSRRLASCFVGSIFTPFIICTEREKGRKKESKKEDTKRMSNQKRNHKKKAIEAYEVARILRRLDCRSANNIELFVFFDSLLVQLDVFQALLLFARVTIGVFALRGERQE
jgi:hypothetical protein